MFEVVTDDNGDGGVEEVEGTYVRFLKKDCSKVTWFGSLNGQYLAMEMSNLAYNSLLSLYPTSFGSHNGSGAAGGNLW